MVIHKKNTKTKQQNNRRFVPSTNTKKLFKGVLQKNCFPRISENFLKDILVLVYFIEKRFQNESFSNNFLISLRAPLECFYGATIKKTQKMKQMDGSKIKPSPVYIMKTKYKRKC